MDLQKVPLDDRGKRSISLRNDLKKAFGTDVKGSKNVQTPSALEIPSFLMNFPFTIDNEAQNNPIMKHAKKPYDYKKVFNQFMGLYNTIAKESLVFLLPSEEQLQDLPFVANIGCYIPHIKPDTIIVSNFKSQPRKGEDKIGKKFFESMGYIVDRPSTYWEGEADLKYIKGNLWIGGCGIRTDIKSYRWMANKFDMDIIPIKMTDQKLYHFDCQFFPLSSDKALVATSILSPEDIKKIEKHIEVISVPKDCIYDGWTNCVKLGNKILCGKSKNFEKSDKENEESDKARSALFYKEGYKPVEINLHEFIKSGADLSCMCMHLNYMDYK